MAGQLAYLNSHQEEQCHKFCELTKNQNMLNHMIKVMHHTVL